MNNNIPITNIDKWEIKYKFHEYDGNYEYFIYGMFLTERFISGKPRTKAETRHGLSINSQMEGILIRWNDDMFNICPNDIYSNDNPNYFIHK